MSVSATSLPVLHGNVIEDSGQGGKYSVYNVAKMDTDQDVDVQGMQQDSTRQDGPFASHHPAAGCHTSFNDATTQTSGSDLKLCLGENEHCDTAELPVFSYQNIPLPDSRSSAATPYDSYSSLAI